MRIVSLVFVLFVGLLSARSLLAEVVTATGIIEAVDADAGAITIRRKTASGEKAAQFNLAGATKIVFNGEVSGLHRFEAGQRVEITYDTKAKQVTKLEAWPKGAVFAQGESEHGRRSLLRGDTLDGWETTGSGAISNWRVKDGTLVNFADGPSLVTVEKFSDFDLHLEFSLPPKCNSGVYLRGRYEVQLLDSAVRLPGGKPVPPDGQCGAIWHLISPSRNVYKGPNEWNTLDVRLEGRTVTVRMNDVKIIDAKKIEKVTSGALDENESQPGPILLQSHAVTGAKFRNIRIEPIGIVP